MSIRRQLALLTALIFVALASIGVLGFVSLQQLQHDRLESAAVSTVIFSLFERKLAADRYTVTQGSDAVATWNKRQKEIEALLSESMDTFESTHRQALADIRADVAMSRKLFQQLTALYQNKHTAAFESQRVEIETQMTATTEKTLQQAFALSTIERSEENTAFTNVLVLATSATLLFFLLLLFSFRIIWKRTVELENKEIEAENILNHLPVGIFLAKFPSGKPILTNPEGIRILGKDVEPNITKNDYSKAYNIVTATDTPYPPDELPLTVTLNTGKPSMKKEIFIKKPDGTKIALQVNAIPISDAGGKIIEALAVFMDITREREVDRMKNEFISLASHQLRTPLSATKWLLEMLMDGDAGKLTKKQMQFVENVNASNERMIELVNALLNVSRIESGKIIVESEPTDIAQIVHTLLKDMKKSFDEKKQKVVVDVAENLPKISVDRKLVRQVYLNLLTNANKYTQKDGTVTIRITKTDNELLSQIIDNGYGIPNDEKKRIFEKFFRGANIIKVEPSGTGLGLYLAKAIIESSHGKIWFESQEGKGTTFSFTLPLSGMEKQKGEVHLE